MQSYPLKKHSHLCSTNMPTLDTWKLDVKTIFLLPFDGSSATLESCIFGFSIQADHRMYHASTSFENFIFFCKKWLPNSKHVFFLFKCHHQIEQIKFSIRVKRERIGIPVSSMALPCQCFSKHWWSVSVMPVVSKTTPHIYICIQYKTTTITRHETNQRWSIDKITCNAIKIFCRNHPFSPSLFTSEQNHFPP